MSRTDVLPVQAVILAGGINRPEMAESTGANLRALTPFRGKPMVDYVIRALQSAESVESVTVVGDVPISDGFTVVSDHGGFVENVYAGIGSVSGDCALITTSDIPFLTHKAVDDFVFRARAEDADLVYPIVRVEKCYARFPTLKRTTVRLKEGEFTGGNMMLVRKAFMQSRRAQIAQAHAFRKSPVRLAMMIGFGTAVKLGASILLKKPLLSIHELESTISRVVGGKARAIISEYVELATDLDRGSDIAAAAGSV